LTPWYEPSGDEQYYVGRAAFLIEYGQFPKLNQTQRDLSAGKRLGFSDFRPPGYPLVLAAFGIPESGFAGKLTYCTTMYGLVAIILISMHLGATAILPGSNWLYAVAAVLGIQPWTFEYIKNQLPDSLTMVLVTAGIGLLVFFIHRRSIRSAVVALIFATLLLSVPAMLRPEMLLFAVVLPATGILLRTGRWHESLLFAAVVACIVGCTVAANVYYRWHVAQELRVYGTLRTPAPGLGEWMGTWIGTESDVGRVFNGVPLGKCSMPDIPARAFADNHERAAVAAIVERLNDGTPYNVDMDTAFFALAANRIRTSPFRYWLVPRIWTTFHLWGNLETNSQLLHALVFVPRTPRRFFLGGLLALKVALLLLSAFAALALWRRRRSCRLWYDNLAILMLTLLVTRTVLMGFVFHSCEHRYMLVAWPACLWLSIYGTFHIVQGGIGLHGRLTAAVNPCEN